MRKLVSAVLVAASVATLATASQAAIWKKVGTTGFSQRNNSSGVFNDPKRARYGAMAWDADGNMYVAANNHMNEAPQLSVPTKNDPLGATTTDSTYAGGITIFKTNGTVVNINLSATKPGAVTKMVTCDGAVYALQNWGEIKWNMVDSYNNAYTVNNLRRARILRVDADGTLTQIYSSGKEPDGIAPNQLIVGMTVGSDGNTLYFETGSPDKNNCIHKYIPATGELVDGQVGVNNGFSAMLNRLDCTQYAGIGNNGDDYFASWMDNGAPAWKLAAFQFDKHAYVWASKLSAYQYEGQKHPAAYGFSNPDWGRLWPVGMEYDAINMRLHALAAGDQTGGQHRALSVTYHAYDPSSQGGMFALYDGGSDSVMGLATVTYLSNIWGNPITGPGSGADEWHSNGIDADYQKQWAISGHCLNPDNGDLYLAYYGEVGCTNPDLGKIVRKSASDGGFYRDVPVPQANAFIPAMAFHDGAMYCEAVTNGGDFYNVYKLISEPALVGGLDEAKASAVGTDLGVSGVTISAKFSTYFYVETYDPVSGKGINGMRVKGTTTLPVGENVTVYGTVISLDGGEKALDLMGTPASLGTNTPVKPVFTVLRAIGSGYGLSNVGALVTVAGNVTSTSPLTINDGSNATGIQIVGTVPTTSGMISVTGIVSLDASGNPVVLVP